jgi:FkbM family methyltransferase
MTEMEAKTKGFGFALRIASGVSTVLADRMNSYSQSGEDLLLWEYFGARTNGFFLEAGANHPTKLSQTWLFELHGWKGILVEPLAKNCELLRQHRPGSRVFQCALGAPEQRGRAQIKVAGGDDALSGLVVDDDVIVERMEEVEVRTLDEVLAEAGNPKLDFMSLDVEGFELQVLRGFDLMRHRPAVILIEDHLEHLLVHRHLARHGYRLVKRTGVNNWYVPKGQPFHMTTWRERLKLFRKMFLGLPFRKIRLSRRRRKHRIPTAA